MWRFHNNGGLHRFSGDAPLKHMTLGRERESTPYWPMILYARRMVRRGQSYAVDSKRSIDLKTQFGAHVSIRYSVLPGPSFINKWFRHGLDISLRWGESRNTLRIHQWFCMLEGWSEEDRAMLLIQNTSITMEDFTALLEMHPWNTWRWGESRNTLRIHQWFCMLEGWSEEDRAMLLIQSNQLTWKLNLSPMCWSGTPFCRGLLLSTNDFVVVWTFLWVGERAGIHSVSTNDFVC